MSFSKGTIPRQQAARRIGLYLGRHAGKGGGIAVYIRSLLLEMFREIEQGKDDFQLVLYGDSSILDAEFCAELFAANFFIAESKLGFFRSADSYFCALPNGKKAKVLIRELPLNFASKFGLGRKCYFLLDQILIPLQARRDGVDLLHCLSNFAMSTRCLLGNLRQLLTLHDLYQGWPPADLAKSKAPKEAKEKNIEPLVAKVTLVQKMYRYLFNRQAKLDISIVCDSELVAKELSERYPERERQAEVVPLGIDRVCAERREQLIAEPKKLFSEIATDEETSSGFDVIFYSEDVRKNFKRTFLAWLESETSSRLLLLGAGALTNEQLKKRLKAFAQKEKASSRFEQKVDAKELIIAPWLTRSQLIDLFLTARSVVVPSLAEGFGFPAYEAMALGVPVVTAPLEHCSFDGATEAGQEERQVFICDPLDSDSITSAISLAQAAGDADRRFDSQVPQVESVLQRRSKRIKEQAIRTMAETSEEVFSMYKRLTA